MPQAIRPLVVVLGIALLDIATPTSAHAQRPLLTTAELRSINYEPFWRVTLDLDRGGFVDRGYLLDDALYLFTDEGDVFALHAGAGLTRWWQTLTNSVDNVLPPSHFIDEQNRSLAVFTTSRRTMILDRLTGEYVADMPMQRGTSSAAVADYESIYFGSADGHFYSFIWNDPRSNSGIFRWKVRAGGPVTASPALVNEGRDLVFASQSGDVFNCTAGFKILNWRFATGGPIISNLVVDDSGVYIASTDRALYRVETDSGDKLWRARFPEPLRTAPYVAGRFVYQYCPDEGITALDADSGERRWQIREARSFAAKGADHVFLTTADHRLVKIDDESGTIVAQLNLPRNVLTIPNTRGSAIYIASPYGQILCARQAGTPHLTPESVALASRNLPLPGDGQDGTTGETGSDSAADPPAPRRADDVVDRDDPLRSRSQIPPLAGKARTSATDRDD